MVHLAKEEVGKLITQAQNHIRIIDYSLSITDADIHY